ncbi:50S ribosomal protein L18 [Candidatus Woesearchaeota archaeon]|nr:50S ribosomal protein L18 [Candidatus Woesearchaeota archaeon]
MTRPTTRRSVPYRRKRAGKTNYKKRLELLKSRQHRLVIRKTNKHVIMQIVDYHPDGDRVVASVSSKRLGRMGWQHSMKNIPACYLTGLLLARASKERDVEAAILDLGLQTPIKGSRLYAALKGAIDGGLAVPTSEDVFPSAERITGAHLQDKAVAEHFNKLKAQLTTE